MDPIRFDALARVFAAPRSRRGLLGGVAALGVGLLGNRAAGAQVTQAQCGNKTCRNNPGRCADGCVCCVYANGNARCRPPGTCGSGTEVSPCQGAPDGGPCVANADCCSGICQGRTCVATVAGTCTSDIGTCGNGACACLIVDGTLTCGDFNCGSGINGPEDCLAGFSFFNSVSDCGRPGCVRPCTSNPECFTGETRIAMADGTSRRIESVAVGDYVLGRSGVNRVEAIMRPRLGSKPLYAFNEGLFFVTAEHPFLTDTGWKAINPSETAAENPRLVFGRLAVGDRLLALAGVPVLAGGGNATETVIPELTAVSVERIRETRADPATPLYNLRLDGDHTYVANDWLVHNK